MHLFLHVDADWPEADRLPAELEAVVRPTRVSRGLHPNGVDCALVFASGTDPAHLSLEAITAAVRCIRSKVPVVAIRSRPGDLPTRVDVITRSSYLAHDLGEVRMALLALYKACPELQAEIRQTGQAVAEAIRCQEWGAVMVAWSAVEKLQVEQPRIAPWLVTPGRILGAWVAYLEMSTEL